MKKERIKKLDIQREKRRARIGFLTCGLAALGVVFLAHWQPRADFDVTGVLWLMQNLLPFSLFSLMFAGAAGALCAWLQLVIKEKRTGRQRAVGQKAVGSKQ